MLPVIPQELTFGQSNQYHPRMWTWKRDTIDFSKPVYVYRNLHHNCFSIRQAGLVQAHTKALIIKDAKYVVNEKGRQRVLHEKKKNVHAFVRGYISTPRVLRAEQSKLGKNAEWPWYEVSYNPYKGDSFVAFMFDIFGSGKMPVNIASSSWCDMCIENGLLAIFEEHVG